MQNLLLQNWGVEEVPLTQLLPQTPQVYDGQSVRTSTQQVVREHLQSIASLAPARSAQSLVASQQTMPQAFETNYRQNYCETDELKNYDEQSIPTSLSSHVPLLPQTPQVYDGQSIRTSTQQVVRAHLQSIVSLTPARSAQSLVASQQVMPQAFEIDYAQNHNEQSMLTQLLPQTPQVYNGKLVRSSTQQVVREHLQSIISLAPVESAQSLVASRQAMPQAFETDYVQNHNEQSILASMQSAQVQLEPAAKARLSSLKMSKDQFERFNCLTQLIQDLSLICMERDDDLMGILSELDPYQKIEEMIKPKGMSPDDERMAEAINTMWAPSRANRAPLLHAKPKNVDEMFEQLKAIAEKKLNDLEIAEAKKKEIKNKGRLSRFSYFMKKHLDDDVKAERSERKALSKLKEFFELIKNIDKLELKNIADATRKVKENLRQTLKLNFDDDLTF